MSSLFFFPSSSSFAAVVIIFNRKSAYSLRYQMERLNEKHRVQIRVLRAGAKNEIIWKNGVLEEQGLGRRACEEPACGGDACVPSQGCVLTCWVSAWGWQQCMPMCEQLG